MPRRNNGSSPPPKRKTKISGVTSTSSRINSRKAYPTPPPSPKSPRASLTQNEASIAVMKSRPSGFNPSVASRAEDLMRGESAYQRDPNRYNLGNNMPELKMEMGPVVRNTRNTRGRMNAPLSSTELYKLSKAKAAAKASNAANAEGIAMTVMKSRPSGFNSSVASRAAALMKGESAYQRDPNRYNLGNNIPELKMEMGPVVRNTRNTRGRMNTKLSSKNIFANAIAKKAAEAEMSPESRAAINQRKADRKAELKQRLANAKAKMRRT
jgi:hypothetical protein